MLREDKMRNNVLGACGRERILSAGVTNPPDSTRHEWTGFTSVLNADTLN